MLHGRAETADGMLTLVEDLGQPDTAYRALQAGGQTWYPHSFLAPLRVNEPYLASAIENVRDVMESIAASGIPPEKTVLLGFSQGACLALEFAARNARQLGGVVSFSGGLIGNGERDAEPPENKLFDYAGSMEGTPVFIGCATRDPHVPLRRIEQTAEVFQRLGGDVTTRTCEGSSHTIRRVEIDFARDLIAGLAD